ncbi:MAG: DNA-3-methyladenine glycosylase [Candidatus Adlerbacteria bacterium]|nr:DNA-3-methyladenine glycosylase [Candidatus Adlerbacteria bacterium]
MAYEASIKILAKDKRFAPLIKAYGPAQLGREARPFEALIRSIVYQQVSGKAAATIFKRFTELFPGKKFPTPEEVSAMGFIKLRGAGLSGQKATYIQDLAQKFADGTIKHRAFKKMTSDEVIAHVTQVKGIGVWTAHMFLIFTLNRPDILPTGDLGIQKGFQIVYGLKKLPTPTQMETLAKPWRAHASAASWYLWRVADDAKLIVKKPRP